MKVLMVTPYPMLPLSHGSRARTYRLATGLARLSAEVDLVCPWSPGQPPRAYRREGVRCHPRFFAVSPLLAISDNWLPSAIPVSWQPHLPAGRRVLRQAAAYDIVQFETAGFGTWMERLAPGVRRVYGSHNVEGDLAGERAGNSRSRRRMAERVAALERHEVRASDRVITCTDADALRFEELYDVADRCSTVPNGFDESLLDTDWTALRGGARDELGLMADDHVLLFVGGASDHNLQAVRFLENSLLPRLPSTARLLVAGKAAAAVRRPPSASVHPLGYVDDLKPLLAAVDLALNSVSYGSGSNVKMAEYLAAGLPVVSTAVGARGFEQYREHVQIAALDEFATAIEGAPRRREPPPGIEELSWNAVARSLHGAYLQLLG
jgi:glycosyltransferase involved in cell wall biosynthesis